MLEDLDAVDWQSIDPFVPELLRAVAYADDPTQSEAITELGDAIYHQGDVYGSGIYAPPFLIELAQERSVGHRDALLWLLQWAGTARLHRSHFDPPNYEQTVRAVHEAVAAGIPVYLRLLDDPDPDVASTSACLLCGFPEHASGIVPALYSHLEQPLPARVNTSIILALGVLIQNQPDAVSVYQSILNSDAPPSLRLAAALALARALREVAAEEAVETLLAARQDPGWDQDLSPWYGWYDGRLEVPSEGPIHALWTALHEHVNQDSSLHIIRDGFVADYVCASPIRRP